jgi:hypothetical protein
MLAIEERAQIVLREVQELAGKVEWKDLAHRIFAPESGLIAQHFPTIRERREFTMTKEYEEMYDILRNVMRPSKPCWPIRAIVSGPACQRS